MFRKKSRLHRSFSTISRRSPAFGDFLLCSADDHEFSERYIQMQALHKNWRALASRWCSFAALTFIHRILALFLDQPTNKLYNLLRWLWLIWSSCIFFLSFVSIV